MIMSSSTSRLFNDFARVLLVRTPLLTVAN